jgi:hypothetical protein
MLLFGNCSHWLPATFGNCSSNARIERQVLERAMSGPVGIAKTLRMTLAAFRDAVDGLSSTETAKNSLGILRMVALYQTD